jgi:predicted ArsR family transcriptional regulator
VGNITKEILSKIAEGKTLDTIGKEMDVRESTVRARVDSMVHEGYLEELRYAAGCSACLMKCSSPPSNSGTKMYTVTDKGIDHIKCV